MAPVVGDRKVQHAVLVQVACPDGVRALPCPIRDRRGERAVATTDEHRDVAAVVVGDREVRMTVPVEIAGDHGMRRAPRAIHHGCLEGPVAVP